MSLPLDIEPSHTPVIGAVIEHLSEVSRCFDQELTSELPPVTQLVRHVENYRGKMLRPMLVLLCGLACSSRHDALLQATTSDDYKALLNPKHAAAAAVCEMVHMATLVHDDVLDEADIRRRGGTVNRLRGNETAVILGDYLIASAYHMCVRLVSQEAAVIIGRASQVMCEGELLQLHHRGDYSLDEPTYFEIVARKTGELISASCELGGLISEATPQIRTSLAAFGRDIGVAFQIQDDLLDLTGTESVVGKSVGKDLEKGKLTLPMIHALKTASLRERGNLLTLLDRATDEQRRTDAKAAAAELSEILTNLGSVDFARIRATELVQRAKDSLFPLPQSHAKGVLLAMANAVIARAS